jgi:hypothetical protein
MGGLCSGRQQESPYNKIVGHSKETNGVAEMKAFDGTHYVAKELKI